MNALKKTDKSERYWSSFYDKKAILENDYQRGVHDSEQSMKSIHDRIISKISDKNGVVLDFGCGVGVLANRLYDLGYNVEGVDISSKLIDIAKSNFGNKIQFNQFSFSELLVSEKRFDTIIASEVIQHLKQEEAVTILLGRLKNGGQLIITGPNDDFLKFRFKQRSFMFRLKSSILKIRNLIIIGRFNKLKGIQLDDFMQMLIKTNVASNISIDCSMIEDKYNNFLISIVKK